MGKIPIGLQLYSVRHDCAKDLPGTLAKVAEMGYEGVEFAGYYDYSAEELREMLDDLGLVCCGTHTSWASVQPDQLDATIAFNQTLGNKYLIVPGLPEEQRNSRAAWLDTATKFNAIAAKLKPLGMLTGYHNHWIEFEAMDGELPWETLFGNTVHDVIMQIDTGNARHGGTDPLPLLAARADRGVTVHLKEFSATNDLALVGEGDEDWAKVFELCENAGNTEWYIVEYERPVASPLDAVAACLSNLRAMGK